MTPQDFADRTGPRSEAFWGAFSAYRRALDESGLSFSGLPLKEPAAGKTVALRHDKRRVQDGPYADTKEQLAGFMVLDARDLDEALEWAARCPIAATGAVEVRPVMAMPGPESARGELPDPPAAVTHVLLLYTDEATEARFSPSERQELMGSYFAYTRALRAAGATTGGAPLEPTSAATTVRLRDGKRLVQDGPFAETKEQLGGYYLLSTRSDSEALDWAVQCPAARYGAVELRPALPMRRS
jgi:hypothetical protein